MLFERSNYEREVRENMRGGAGSVIIDNITKDYPKNCRMVAEIVLKPGCEIGYHGHEKEVELFTVLKGETVLNDDGNKLPFKAGDTHICYSGSSHGVINESNEDAVLLAVIITE